MQYQGTSRRLAYPLLGALLALGAPAGLFVLRATMTRATPSVPWLVGELASIPAIYAYLTSSTMLVFASLGFVLGRKNDLLEELSTTDPLTWLPNRRLFDDRLHEELLRAARYGTPLSLLLIDVDRLKDINDRGGHEAGDAALRAVADCLRQSCRTTDLPARYGGDEFAILAPGIDARGAIDLAKRLQVILERTQPRPAPQALTISTGVSEFHPIDRASPETLRVAADQALYMAKSTGRNCSASVPPIGPLAPAVA